MTTGFIYLRPMSVVSVRAHGEAAAAEAWQKMFSWLRESGMHRKTGCGYGLMLDDRLSTSPTQCRYEACIELLSGYEHSVPQDFEFRRLPGGAYGRIRQPIGLEPADAIAVLRQSWAPQNGLTADTTRPTIEVFLDDPLMLPVSMQRVDICVPVVMGATTLKHRSAA